MSDSIKGLLLVEGNHDKHVILALCEKHAVPETFDIKAPQEAQQESDVAVNSDGLSGLWPLLGTQLKVNQGTGAPPISLAIVIDADTNLDQRWQALCQLLVQQGYTQIPPKPPATGLVLPATDKLPKFGAWLMPNNQTTGVLEDFVRFLVPADDVLLPHADTVLQSLPETRFADKDRAKALIHTWLAWQKTPDSPMGRAISQRFLDANVPEAKLFVQWLNAVFN